jgi:hypothetical protein
MHLRRVGVTVEERSSIGFVHISINGANICDPLWFTDLSLTAKVFLGIDSYWEYQVIKYF